MRFTNVSMEWTDEGAVCCVSVSGFGCPRCGEGLQPNIEHRCGDKVAMPGTANAKLPKGKPRAGGKQK